MINAVSSEMHYAALPTCTLKGAIYEIQKINITANIYLLCKDMVEKWCPKQRIKSNSLCLRCNPSVFVLYFGSWSGHVWMGVPPCETVALSAFIKRLTE